MISKLETTKTLYKMQYILGSFCLRKIKIDIDNSVPMIGKKKNLGIFIVIQFA